MNQYSFRKWIAAALISSAFAASVYYVHSTDYFLRTALIIEEEETADENVNAEKEIQDAKKNLNSRKKVFQDMNGK